MFGRILLEQERRSLLFGEMLKRFGFDPERNLTMREVIVLSRGIERCRRCGEVERCEAWLNESSGCSGAKAFCPNATALSSMMER